MNIQLPFLSQLKNRNEFKVFNVKKINDLLPNKQLLNKENVGLLLII